MGNLDVFQGNLQGFIRSWNCLKSSANDGTGVMTASSSDDEMFVRGITFLSALASCSSKVSSSSEWGGGVDGTRE